MEKSTYVLVFVILAVATVFTATVVVDTAADGSKTIHLEMNPGEAAKLVHNLALAGYTIEENHGETVIVSDGDGSGSGPGPSSERL